MDAMVMDFNMFDAALARLIDVSMPEAVSVAAGQAGMALLNDAIMEMPTVPLGSTTPPEGMTPSEHPGFLRSSGSVFVQGKLIHVTPVGQYGGSPATQVGDGGAQAGVVEVIVGFNTPYAAYQHEGVRADGSHRIKRWAEPGSGIKFLESKMVANSRDYIAHIAEVLKNWKG